jgi:hypothetical protein
MLVENEEADENGRTNKGREREQAHGHFEANFQPHKREAV